jgi:hypothetical protein
MTTSPHGTCHERRRQTTTSATSLTVHAVAAPLAPTTTHTNDSSNCYCHINANRTPLPTHTKTMTAAATSPYRTISPCATTKIEQMQKRWWWIRGREEERDGRMEMRDERSACPLKSHAGRGQTGKVSHSRSPRYFN